MDFSGILKMAGETFLSKIDKDGNGLDLKDVTGALGGLITDENGNLDMMALVSLFQNQGLGGLVSSWLGDGGNDPIDAQDIIGALGQDNINKFAGQLGVSGDTAVSGLESAIPFIIDKVSSGGNIQESFGQVSDVLGGAMKLFS